MSNKIRLTVGGMQYSITTDDSEEYVREIGRELNRRMDFIAKKSPFLSTTMVAVMAALEAYDVSKKQAAENDELRLELKRSMEDAALLKLELDRTRKLLAELNETMDGDANNLI